MPDDASQLKFAQWVLERNLAWIATSDVKTGVVVAVNTAMLGGLATAFNAAHGCFTAWAWGFSVTGAMLLCAGVFCAAMALFPRIAGPADSLIFAAGVTRRTSADYADHLRQATPAALLADCLAQVHRNAEIAIEKFEWVRAAMAWSFIGVLPWTAALAVLIRH